MCNLIRNRVFAGVLVSLLVWLPAASAGNAKGVSARDMDRLHNIRQLYHENCAMCHGEDGVPIVPGTPDFSKGERMSKSDAELLKTIREGKEMMPPWKDEMSKKKRAALLNYVRRITGDQVFQEKCSSCHNLRVAPFSDSIPKTEQGLLQYKGPKLDICSGHDVEASMDRKQIVDVILFIRSLQK